MRQPRSRFTIRGLMAVVATVAITVWFTREMIRPRLPAGRFAMIGSIDNDRDDRNAPKRIIRGAAPLRSVDVMNPVAPSDPPEPE